MSAALGSSEGNAMLETFKKCSISFTALAGFFAAALFSLLMATVAFGLVDVAYAQEAIDSIESHYYSAEFNDGFDDDSVNSEDAATASAEDESCLIEEPTEGSSIAAALTQRAATLSATSASFGQTDYPEYMATFDESLTGGAFAFGVCLLVAAIML